LTYVHHEMITAVSLENIHHLIQIKNKRKKKLFLVMRNFRIHLQFRRPWSNSSVRKIRWRRNRLPMPVLLGFPGGSADKESACNEGDLGSIPGLGRSPGEGRGYPLQYSGLENSMDHIVHGVAKSRT